MWISLLSNFIWFLGVEIKWHEDKIRLLVESLADAKNARSENRDFAGFTLRSFWSLSFSEGVYGWPMLWHLLLGTSLWLQLHYPGWGLKASLSAGLRGELLRGSGRLRFR